MTQGTSQVGSSRDRIQIPSPREFGHWIGGQWTTSQGEPFIRENPGNGELVGRYRNATPEEVDSAVRSARQAFDQGVWSDLSGEDRSRVLERTAQGILARTEELAAFEMVESGKPLRQARVEIERSAALWSYAATQARSINGSSFAALGKGLTALTIKEPVGPVAIITPWNFPFLIISQKLPFALAAGCTCVVKPSELTPATTLLLGEILKAAGLPDGVVNIVAGHGDPTGDALISHPEIEIISFTGSTRVGKHAMRTGADRIAKVALELGGKNPHIVFADANLEHALDAVLHGAFANAGQSCNCGSRLLLERSIADAFTEKLIAAARKIPVGSPLDENTLVGPIINEAQFNRIISLIAAGKEEGAVLALGGTDRRINGGRYIDPTIFVDVTRDMRIAREEIFGPVLSILTFESAEEAIALANHTAYGLSAGVWTRDISVAIQAARGIKAGTIWINTYLDGPAELPFGGYKESGIGREVGLAGVEDFMEIKTIQIRDAGYSPRWIGPRISPDSNDRSAG
jgi:betaine-aldehyde dehydrogenase